MKATVKIFIVICLFLIGSLQMYSQISSQVINACLPSSTHSFQLSNPPSNPASICWDLGDGLGFVCNNSIRAQAIYNSPGYKNILCRVESSPGIFYQYSTTILVDIPPNPFFGINQTSTVVCSTSANRTFNLLDTVNVSSVVWEVYSKMGAKISGTQSFANTNFSFSYSFQTSDTFRVKAIVFNRDFCVRDTSLFFPIKLVAPIGGSFSSNLGVKSCLPADYSFTPSLQLPVGRSIQSLVWTLSDQAGVRPSQQFIQNANFNSPFRLPTLNQPGNYQVSLLVVSNGCSTNINPPFNFSADHVPVLNFSVNGSRVPIQVCLNQSFEVLNQTVLPSNSVGGSFSWDFYGLVRNSGAIRTNYVPKRVNIGTGSRPSSFVYNQITPSDSGVNSIILKWNGACPISDTLKNVVITKGPLSRAIILHPSLPIDCDTPFSFVLSDSTSWKPNGFSYTHRWFRYDSLFNLMDSIEGTPKSTFFDTIRGLPERRFYQLKIISSDGCADTSSKLRMETRKPKAVFAPFPWFPNQTLDTLSCDSTHLFYPFAFQAFNPLISPYYHIIPYPITPNFFYNVKLFSPNWPASNAPCLETGTNKWERMREIRCIWIGPNIVRQIVGIDTGFTKCTDTLTQTFFVKNFQMNWGRKVNGNVIPNPSGICLGPNGSPVNQIFHIYEDTIYRWPAYNQPYEYIWTLSAGPNTSQIVVTQTPFVNFNFSNPGIYTIYVQVKSNGNCTREYSTSIKVGEIASISPAPNLGDTLVVCANSQVNDIIGMGSIGSQFTFRWEVFRATPTGRGLQINPLLAGSPLTLSSITASNPTLFLNHVQPFYLVLYVTNEFGCVDSTQLLIRGSTITALIRPDTLMACPGYQLFRSLSTDATQYNWEFTDPIGNLGNPLVTNLIHSAPKDSVLGYFAYGGIKTVKLTVTSIYGCLDDTTMNVRVGGPIPLLTVVTPTSKKGCDSLNVVIIDSSKNIDRYVFSWGDGSSGYWIGQTNRHVYSYPYSIRADSAISYVFQLIAIGQSCIIPYRDTITVYPRPKVGGILVSDSLCSPATFTINDTSKFAPNGNYGAGSSNTIYSWNFNDGTGWTSQTAPVMNRSLRKTIVQPGSYNIQVAITNPWGCVDTNFLTTAHVLDTPIANFYAVDSAKCWSNGSNGFVFNDASSYPNSTARGWKWYWSDPTAIPNGQNGYTTTGPSTGSVNFTVPGANINTTHTISLVVTNAFGCTDSIAKPNYITVRDTVPPAPINPKYITVDPLTLRNHVEINWAAVSVSDFLNYEIFRNNTRVATITNSSTTTYNDVIDVVAAGTSQNYKMRVNDICNQASPFDTTHSTIYVKVNGVATGGYATNNVTFNAYEGWGVQTNLGYYEVYRKKGAHGSYAPVGRVSPVVGNANYLYVDSGLCADTFYYYVKAFHKNYSEPQLGYYSISNYDSIVSNFNIIRTPVEINYVTVDDPNQISIQWTPAPLATGVLKNYLVERYDAGSPNVVVVYRGIATTCTDKAVNTGTTIYKYVVRYEDQCGNLSNYSDTSVNILASSATQKIANYDAYDMKITWTPYSIWKSGVLRYDIEVRYPDGWRNIGSVPGNALTFLDVNVPRNEIEGAYCYRIKAIENEPIFDSSYSNITSVIYPSNIIVPSAFSPNNDGTNDTHFVHAVAINSFDFVIYNRWGESVFQSNDLQIGWNGRLKNLGESCPPGVYVYVLNAKGKDKKNYFRKGTITLLK